MANQQLYLVQKYVMAVSAIEALSKSKRVPIHEVYISSMWQEKVAGGEFYREESKNKLGFDKLSPPAVKSSPK